MPYQRRLAVLIVGTVLIFKGGLFAATINVNLDGSGDYTTIYQAVDAAVSGDVIIVAPGVYDGGIEFAGKNITLRSTDPADWSVVQQTVMNGGNPPVLFSGSETAACQLKGFTITGGYTETNGGAVQGGTGSHATISNCIIINNTAANAGGAIQGFPGTIRNCIVRNNYAVYGGAFAGCFGRIENCLVSANYADYGGVFNNCDGEIINCTIVGNSTVSEGIFRACDGTVTNCIIWYNSGDIFYSSTATVTYSCYAGGTGTNINAEPIFYNSGSDYRLRPYSPCVDTGTNTPSGGLASIDIDGNSRPADGNGDGSVIADMGAYEGLACANPIIELDRHRVNFCMYEGQSTPVSVTMPLTIKNVGIGQLDWQVTKNCEWIKVSPQSGSLSEGANTTISVNIGHVSGFALGEYSCQLNVTGTGVPEGETVDVYFRVIEDDASMWVPYEYPTIQQAVNAAANGDEIILAEGTYTGSGNRDVNIYNKSLTIRSESGRDNCIIDCQGTLLDNHRGFYVYGNSTASVTIEDITIQNGLNYSGGAMYLYYCANVRIAGCDFLNNSTGVGYSGAAIYYYSCSDVEIEDCRFIGNTAAEGACISCYLREDTQFDYLNIRGCDFIDNFAWYYGAAICLWPNDYIENPLINYEISDCRFEDNYAVYYGGAILSYYLGGAIENCQFINNNANYAGGAMAVFAYEHNYEISRSIFESNSSDNYGGAVFGVAEQGSGDYMNMNSCLLDGNTAGYYGGGLYWEGGTMDATNCTMVKNTAVSSGGGIRFNLIDSGSNVTNCLLWGNSVNGSTSGTSQVYANSATVSYNCIQNWTSGGTGNISSAPYFVDYANGNYRLKPISACVDSGTNNPAGQLSSLDLDGKARVLDGNGDYSAVVDMGAYEGGEITDMNFDFQTNMIDFAYFSADWLVNNAIPGSPLETLWLELDEGSGEAAFDSSPNGYHGTMLMMTQECWVPKDDGYALSFNGTDAHVLIDGYRGIGGSDPRTCCAWVKTTDGTADVITWGQLDTGKKWILGIFSNKPAVIVQGGNIFGSTIINDNQWHHIAAVLADDGSPNVSEVKLYVNGIEEQISAATPIAVNTALVEDVDIGRFSPGPNYFAGLMDDVRIYSYALSAQEIFAVYQGQSIIGTACINQPQADVNDDCRVDTEDLLIFAEKYLSY